MPEMTALGRAATIKASHPSLCVHQTREASAAFGLSLRLPCHHQAVWCARPSCLCITPGKPFEHMPPPLVTIGWLLPLPEKPADAFSKLSFSIVLPIVRVSIIVSVLLLQELPSPEKRDGKCLTSTYNVCSDCTKQQPGTSRTI